MTPKIIELKQAPVVLIELPEGEIAFFNIHPSVRSEIESRGFAYHGRLLHLTEEQFAECVRKHATLGLYRDYTSIYEAPTRVFMMPTARGSFNTLRTCEDITYTGEVVVSKSSLTIDPKRTVVLIRKEEQ